MVMTWLHRGCGVRAKLKELDWNECVFTSLQACKMCLNEASSINGIRFFSFCFFLVSWLDQRSWFLALLPSIT